MVTTDLFNCHFIPAYRKSNKLILVLHGKGDSLKPFKEINNELDLKEFNYLLLNAPKKFLGGYSWYGEPPYQKKSVLKIREKIFQLLEKLEIQGWKARDIYFLGFSQGCLVSADVALNYPKRLGGLVGISGYFQFYPRWRKQLNSSKKTPWLLTHGRKDDVLPIEDTKFGVEKLRWAGLNIDWVESDKKHSFEEAEYSTIRNWLLQKMKC